MRNFLFITLCVFFSRVARASCETPTHVSQLGEAGRAAEVAFAELNAEALLTQASLARTQILPCVGETLNKQDAAAFHRLMAMEAFIAGDYTRAKRELHASLLLQSGYTFPSDVAGEGHPLLTLYTQAETLPDGDGEKIYPPPDGYVLVGGVRNAARYSQTPVIFQVFTVTEGVEALRETRYIQPGEATPNWSGNAFGLTAADFGIYPDDWNRSSILRKSRPWYIAAGSTALVSGVLLGVALHKRSVYLDPSTPDGDLASLESGANRWTNTALISGVSALGFAGLGIGLQLKFGPDHKSTTNSHKEEAASP